jgi:tetratricopeptide (TPR) repeat protein
MLARRRGNTALAADSLAASLELYRQLDDRQGTASALRGLGYIHYLHDDYDSARALFDEALALFRSLNDQEGVAVTLDNLGYISDDPVEGQRLFQESLALRRRSGNLRGITMSLAGLAYLAGGRAEYDVARQYMQENMQINEKLGDMGGIANAHLILGDIATAEGDYATARLHFETSKELCLVTGNRLLLPAAIHRLGIVSCQTGEFSQARALFEEAIRHFQGRSNVMGIISVLADFAALAAAQGWGQQALRLAGAVAALCQFFQISLNFQGQGEFERTQKLARALLNEQVAHDAWQAGQAMALDEAVRYALAKTENPK